MKPNGFPKEEKLKNKTDISLLFEQGKWFSYKELAIISLQKEDLPTRKVGVSVSKKFFKKAVDRNRVKRLLRETYRLNKPLFIKTFGENSLNMIFYRSAKLPKNMAEIESLFLKLCEEKKLSSIKNYFKYSKILYTFAKYCIYLTILYN